MLNLQSGQSCVDLERFDSVQMSPRDAPQRPGRGLWHTAALVILGMFMMLSCCGVVAQTTSTEAVEVTTPEEFQEQVRLGTPHIVITQHLDMSTASPFMEGTVMPNSLISLVNSGDAITQTIRVRSR